MTTGSDIPAGPSPPPNGSDPAARPPLPHPTTAGDDGEASSTASAASLARADRKKRAAARLEAGLDEPPPPAEWEERFLAALQTSGSVTKAWKAAGITRTYAYEWRGRRPDFAKRWDEVADVHRDNLESSAMARAIGGVEEPVIFKGVPMLDPKTGKVLTVQKFDSALTMFMLKAHRPERYRGCDWRGFDGPAGVTSGSAGEGGPLERAQAVRQALELLEKATIVPPPPPPAAVESNGHAAAGNGAHP
jgi:hypothetical protein